MKVQVTWPDLVLTIYMVLSERITDTLFAFFLFHVSQVVMDFHRVLYLSSLFMVRKSKVVRSEVLHCVILSGALLVFSSHLLVVLRGCASSVNVLNSTHEYTPLSVQ